MSPQRRTPKQARAKQKYQAILDCTAQLITEQGADKLTTHMVAQRAGIAVGSLYQFFPNIESVKIALIERVLGKLHEQVSVKLADSDSMEIGQLTDTLIDATLAFYHQFPDVVQTILASRYSEAYLTVNENLNLALTESLLSFLAPKHKLPEAVLQSKIYILIRIGDIMTQQVWMAADEQQRQLQVDEWKLLSRTYAQQSLQQD